MINCFKNIKNKIIQRWQILFIVTVHNVLSDLPGLPQTWKHWFMCLTSQTQSWSNDTWEQSVHAFSHFGKFCILQWVLHNKLTSKVQQIQVQSLFCETPPQQGKCAVETYYVCTLNLWSMGGFKISIFFRFAAMKCSLAGYSVTRVMNFFCGICWVRGFH